MSNRLKALRESQADITSKMEAILSKASEEKRDLKPEEVTAYDALETELGSTTAMIKREQKLAEARAALAQSVADAPITLPANTAARAMPRYGALKAFTPTVFGSKQDAEASAYRSGMWIRALFLKDDNARTWCQENGIQFVRAASGQSEGTNTAGGYLVPAEFSQSIIDLREAYGTFRTFAKMVPMGRDTITFPRRSSGATAYWVGENAQITASTKAWDQVSLVAKKLGALALISSELAEDAVINIADDLAQEFAYQFAIAEDAAGWNGDGSPTYGNIRGIRTKIIDGTHTKSAINAASGHNTFAEVDATDLANLMAACPKYALRNAKFYCSQVAFSTVFARLAVAAGGNTMETLAGPQYYRYQGYPIVIDQTLPGTSGSTDYVNTAMLFFGDLSLACMMGERRGFTVKVTDDRYFEFDQTGIMATERIDINAHDLGDTTNAGPLIALVGA